MSQISSLIQFIAGTKAKASEVNSNFEDLRISHNNTDTNLTNLNDRHDNLNIVYVKDYGAKGDSVTDDTDSINNALSTQKNVFLPEGIYKISGELSLKTSAQKIHGQGKTKTTINAIQSSGNIIYSPYSLTTIQGLRLDGNNNPLTGIKLNPKTGSGLSKPFNQAINDVQIWAINGGTGVQISAEGDQSSADGLIKNVQISYAEKGIESKEPTWILIKPVIDHCATGLHVDVNSKFVIIGGVFSENTDDIWLNEAELASFGTWYENCTGYNLLTKAQFFYNATFSGCRIHNHSLQSYCIDCATITQNSQMTLLNNNFIGDVKDIYLGNNVCINGDIAGNRSIGAISGNFRRDDKLFQDAAFTIIPYNHIV